jgi:histidinol phosphatase-like PHP family hydrolase
MEIMTNNAKFTIMAHDNRHLIIKASENGNPHVIAECFLEQVAAQICELLTAAADANLTLENAHKQK